MVFLGRSTPGHDLGNARHGKQSALDDPVLDAPQVRQAVGGGPYHLVAQYFTNQAGGLYLGLHIVRQTHILLQVDRNA